MLSSRLLGRRTALASSRLMIGLPLFTLCLSWTHGFAQAGKTELFGTITDPSKLPVPNARVQAQAMALGQRITYLDEGEVKKRAEDPDPYGRAWDLWKRQAAEGGR